MWWWLSDWCLLKTTSISLSTPGSHLLVRFSDPSHKTRPAMAEEENPAKRLRPNSVSGTSSKSSSGMKDRNMDYICPICFDLIRYIMGTMLSISRDIFLAAKLTSPSVVTPSATPVSSRPSSRTAGQTPARSKPQSVSSVAGVRNVTSPWTLRSRYSRTFSSMNWCPSTRTLWRTRSTPLTSSSTRTYPPSEPLSPPTSSR